MVCRWQSPIEFFFVEFFGIFKENPEKKGLYDESLAESNGEFLRLILKERII